MTLGLFDGYGVEVEYMLVDRERGAVWPGADKLLARASGQDTPDPHDPPLEIERGSLRWSNELTLHVIELKTNGPTASLRGLSGQLHAAVREIHELLAPLGATLLPGGMHPTMDPRRETRLWPHAQNDIYEAYDRIFGCQGHGWSNLQSVHLNLPFANDDELGRLHAAVRLLLPLLPALAAASPIAEGRYTGWLDTRMEVYRHNARRVPEVTGDVVPEAVFTRADYEREILEPMYRAMRPFDPEGVLRHEWLNSRGAIARFERDALEIRVLDTQESPFADVAVLAAVVTVLEALCQERLSSYEAQRKWPTERLARILSHVVRDADEAWIHDEEYLKALGVHRHPATAGEVWRSLLYRLPLAFDLESRTEAALETLLERGPLARRMLRFAGPELTPVSVEALERELSACLIAGRMLDG